jgi:integrase
VRRRPNGEGTCYRTKDGTYKAQMTVTVNGRQKRLNAAGKTEAKAFKALREREAEWRKTAAAFGSVPTDVTLGEYLASWLASTEVRVSTRKARSSHVDRITSALGERPLCEVSSADVRALLARLDRDDVGTRQRQMVYETLRAALNEAVRQDLIASNPALRVRKPKHQRVEYPALDVAGADRLILAAKAGEESTLYTLAVQTGLRQGELLALTWEDVDFDRVRVYVRKTLTKDENGRLVRTEPKTARSVRDVPFPKRALSALRDLRASCDGTGFVFTTRDKGNVLRRFYKTLKRAGLSHVKFHSLRVTSNSVLIEQGADPVEIAARMGHTSTRMTLDVYARLFNDRQGRLALLMDRAFDGRPAENHRQITADLSPAPAHRRVVPMEKRRGYGVFLSMETSGLEPLTSCLQSRRSTS